MLREARYALARYDRETGLVDHPPTDEILDALALLAAGDALAAARAAIIGRAVTLAQPIPERPAPVIVAIDEGTRCGAERFDGRERRQCTRPASFTRDGLAVCRQHARLGLIRAAQTG